jgi:hypothetical protein
LFQISGLLGTRRTVGNVLESFVSKSIFFLIAKIQEKI